MICKNCQHNNPEPNRFCGMCGQPLFRPQSNARSTTNTATPLVNNARQTSYLRSQDTPPPVTTLPPVTSRVQSPAGVSAEKKVQFPPVAPPPASRAAAPVAATPTPQAPGAAGQSGARANGTPAERPAQTPAMPSSTPSQPFATQSTPGVERRGPFPKTPLGPQPATTAPSLENERPGVDNKIQTPSRAATPPPVESRAQNQVPYSRLADMKPWTPETANRAAAEKPPATGSPVAEKRTQPLASSQRPAAATAAPPATKAQTSAPIRVTGPSFLGLSDDAVEVTPKDREYDDLYKTHWGGRIAIAIVVLGIVVGLAYLQWRSGHAAASTTTPKPPTAARVDSPSASAPAAAANPTNPPAAASTQAANHAAANTQSAASNTAGNSQLPNGSEQSPTNLSAPAAPPAKAAAAPSANSPKAASQANPIREGHEIASKSQEDLEEPVRLAESYIQGRGVAQNCGAALGILRNASDRGNPRAEIKLGALYATGNCVAPDRVAAYRHFSRAIAAQPNNVYLEETRSHLWKEMSDSERKQAMEVEK